ncbi:MAG: AMP-dependent synthetase/ligase [Pseudomonadota bacterium]|uniref:AMP-dependent synthetase/ligase n=1 Tax=Fodinicurvata fenggangensis TaxID=1121830 RepID=UPI000B33C04A|nr:long-chain fatty acid--CoA ligase [Fodinicurvata fenggangensis]
MDYDRVTSLPSAFFQKANEMGDLPFLWVKTGGSYTPWTWHDVRLQVLALAHALQDMGVKKGDRVLLVSENRPEWFIADFAIMTSGGITVPAYTTNTSEDHEYLLKDSSSDLAIVSTAALAKPLLKAITQTNLCKQVITIEPLEDNATNRPESLYVWEELLNKYLPGAPNEAVLQDLKREDTACFIYTSGTGGAPKGVMLSHASILANCTGAYDLLAEYGLGRERFLSFLPLSHSYEHTVGQIFAMSIGAEIYYAEAVETLLTNISESRPTIMTAVPRLYEMLYQRLNRKVDKGNRINKLLFRQAERLGKKKYYNNGKLPLWERPLDLLAELTVRQKIRAHFGGQLKAMVSGGAALNTDVGLFFHALGLPILQGYGQTEASPVVSVNRPHHIKMETVGPPLKGVQVRTGEDGEILVRGELVMQGYWNRPRETKETIRDGWLHTGDIGAIDEDGYIHITDRKKDLIVLTGGDNISPARLETLLNLQPEISQSLIFGDKHSHLVALIVPDPEWAGKFASDNSDTHSEELTTSIREAVDRVNAGLSVIEKIRRFSLSDEAFTVENDMLTPTMKIRRHIILEKYRARLEALY